MMQKRWQRFLTFVGVSVTSCIELGMRDAAAGITIGWMITPYVAALACDAFVSVPQHIRDGSDALGATRAETVCRAVLPAALSGLSASVLLAFGRAVGETMVVVMAAGLSAKITANPFEALTTVTAQIAALLTGDQAFDRPETNAAFALGLVLFLATWILNVIALRAVQRVRLNNDKL